MALDNETVFSQMWSAYRGVILHSIVTSFGLDFLVHDQHGGDVDTIHGVRESGQYKNPRNAADYEGRGEYDCLSHHGGLAADFHCNQPLLFGEGRLVSLPQHGEEKLPRISEG